MGILQKIFGNAPKPPNGKSKVETMTVYTPDFTAWNGQIYESELVRSAVDARARHISKLAIEFTGRAQPQLVAKLKRAPNSWQTWSQFLYRVSTILDIKNTAFIVPVFSEYGDVVGIYPINSDNTEVKEYNGDLWLVYHFYATGEVGAMELSRVGVLTKHQFKSDYFGESNDALSPTMKLINVQNQGITEGTKSAATYRFVGRATNFAFGDDLAAYRRKFNEDNFSAEDGGGALFFPNTIDNIQQITSKPYVIDAEQMKLIDTRIYNYFGVNEKILQNSATGDDWSAFYEGAVEPFGIQLSEVMTRMLFTANEVAHGAGVIFTSNRLQYMNNADKLQISRDMLDRGIFTMNQVLDIWNLPHIEGEEGNRRIIRGEYYDAAAKMEEDNAEND